MLIFMVGIFTIFYAVKTWIIPQENYSTNIIDINIALLIINIYQYKQLRKNKE